MSVVNWHQLYQPLTARPKPLVAESRPKSPRAWESRRTMWPAICPKRRKPDVV